MLDQGGDTAAAIAVLDETNRRKRHPELERSSRELRKRLGIDTLEGGNGASHDYPEPAAELPAPGPAGVPEVSREDLTPEVLRGAILAHGCLLVRGLVDRDRAEEMAAGIERGFNVRAELEEGESDLNGYYDEIQVERPYYIVGRPFIGDGGGMLAADSPRLLREMLELIDDSGLKPVIEGYLGEAPLISAEKCTLRRTTADLQTGWHQDGKFLGDVRALNLWLSLSRCGDVAPGLDLVPRRIEEFYDAGGEGTNVEIEIPQERAEELAEPEGISRPIFEPGDALLFDHFLLHTTGSDPSMTETRYAIESWFFTPSAFPDGYLPIIP